MSVTSGAKSVISNLSKSMMPPPNQNNPSGFRAPSRSSRPTCARRSSIAIWIAAGDPRWDLRPGPGGWLLHEPNARRSGRRRNSWGVRRWAHSSTSCLFDTTAHPSNARRVSRVRRTESGHGTGEGVDAWAWRYRSPGLAEAYSRSTASSRSAPGAGGGVASNVSSGR